MIKVVPEETIPAEVFQYMLPSEKRVITVRRHAVVLTPAAFLLAADVIAFTLSATGIIPGEASILAGLGLLFPLSCYFLYRSLRAYLRAYVVITSGRIMLVNLRWKNPLIVIPLMEAYNMTLVHMSLFGRKVGYGSFLIRKSDFRRRAFKIRHLPYPVQLYLEVSGLLFPADREYRATRSRAA